MIWFELSSHSSHALGFSLAGIVISDEAEGPPVNVKMSFVLAFHEVVPLLFLGLTKAFLQKLNFLVLALLKCVNVILFNYFG